MEVEEFGTADPALRGEITITLADADGGTNLVAVHDGLPAGVSPADNEAGWQEALARLAALVETSPHRGPGRLLGHTACHRAQKHAPMPLCAR